MINDLVISRIEGYTDCLIQFGLFEDMDITELVKCLYDYVHDVSPLDTKHEEIVKVVAQILRSDEEEVEAALA